MSNQNGNEQEFVHLTPESGGTNAEKDEQQKQGKKKPLTAFVQIAFDGPTNPVKVELSEDCSTVAEHAAFLLEKINESQGNLIGLQLNGPVVLAAVSKEDVFLMKHNIPLQVDCKYTFRFKLAKVQEEVMDEDVPDPVEELAKQLAQMAKEKEEMKKQMDGLAEKVAQMEEEQAKNMAHLLEEQAKVKAKSAEELAKCQDQLKDVKNALEKLVEIKAEQQGQMEQLKKEVEYIYRRLPCD